MDISSSLNMDLPSFENARVFLVGRKLAPRSQSVTAEKQVVHASYAPAGQTPQQTATSANAQVAVKRAAEVNCTAGESAARKVVAGEERGGVLWVREREVEEDALDDDEDTDCEDADADDGGDPVDRRLRSPTWSFVSVHSMSGMKE